MRHLLRTTVQNLCAVNVTAQLATIAVVLLFSISLLALPFVTQANTTNSVEPATKSAEAHQTEPSVKFLKDIAPILDKQGCSAGMCHGKFGGQGGLNLSLLTLNPETDYEPIVHHNRGRRVNLLEPEQSLFFLKPTGQVPHEGGLRFDPNSEDALKNSALDRSRRPFFRRRTATAETRS